MHPDVLVIVNESIGRKQLFPWSPYGLKDTAVFHLLDAHADHSVWFRKATTVAPVTNVAFPAILTGLGPEAATASFKTAPLLWHDARAAGYTTALYSAQDYKYSFFGEYFLGDNDHAGRLPHGTRVRNPANDRFGDRRRAPRRPVAIDFIKAASPTSRSSSPSNSAAPTTRAGTR